MHRLCMGLILSSISNITSTRSRTRNLKYTFNTGDSAVPRPVLNFLFLVHALALLDPDNDDMYIWKLKAEANNLNQGLSESSYPAGPLQ